MSDAAIIKYRTEPVYARDAFDWYVEDAACVDKLLDAVSFVGPIYDPACGAGTIPTVCRRRGLIATGADIADRGFGETGINFLDDARSRMNIVSNPPYKDAERFILHALKVTKRKIAMLVRLAFLESQGRYKRLFIPHPPAQVLVFATRPSMPPGGTAVAAKGGKVAYCWCVWACDHEGDTRIGWLP